MYAERYKAALWFWTRNVLDLCKGVSSVCDSFSGCRHSIQPIRLAIFCFLPTLLNLPERFAGKQYGEVRCSCSVEQPQGRLHLFLVMTSAAKAQHGVLSLDLKPA